MNLSSQWRDLLCPGDADDYIKTRHRRPFSPDAVGYCPANAWWLCELSRLVYRRGPEEAAFDGCLPTRQAVLFEVGLREWAFFNHGGAQAALVISDGQHHPPFCALVFRGTQGRIPNWLTNLDAAPVPWRATAKVHRGFKRLFDGIWPHIAPLLSVIDIPLYYTGHSLGGALATLAAAVHPPDALYTFGSPRVGNAAFARGLDGVPVYRVRTASDIVTTIPPAGPPFGYCHVGIPQRLAVEGTGVGRHGATSLRRASIRHPAPALSLAVTPEFLFDHAPVRYKRIIETSPAADGIAVGGLPHPG